MGTYMGVDTDDSDIVNAIRNMDNRGASKEQIMKVVGMPYEVIDKHVARNQDEKRSAIHKAFIPPEAKTPGQAVLDELKKQAQRERMAKARAARKPKQVEP